LLVVLRFDRSSEMKPGIMVKTAYCRSKAEPLASALWLSIIDLSPRMPIYNFRPGHYV
jgi:hypothetical protein